MKEHLEKARLDFTPVPLNRRRSPGRIKSIPARLYVGRWGEHRDAYQFLQDVQKLHGAGGKTLVRSLLCWRDEIAEPLEQARAKGERIQSSSPLAVALKEFSPIETLSDNIKHVSVRLYIDKWLEHREAYEFLQRQQRLHGEGNKTIIKSLIYYRDNIWKELQGE